MMVLAILPVQTMAIDPIDLTQNVSVTINYKNGARFDLYCVADSDEYAVFTLSDVFSGFKRDINSCRNSEDWGAMTKNVAAYVKANHIRPMSTALVQNEKCLFSGLKAGLYLAVGHDVDDGDYTYSCEPFLICLPDHDGDDTWTYDATAIPKYTFVKHTPTPPTPPTPHTPPELPQTGQLWWPVPVLACGGLLSLLIGIIVRRRGTAHE